MTEPMSPEQLAAIKHRNATCRPLFRGESGEERSAKRDRALLLPEVQRLRGVERELNVVRDQRDLATRRWDEAERERNKARDRILLALLNHNHDGDCPTAWGDSKCTCWRGALAVPDQPREGQTDGRT